MTYIPRTITNRLTQILNQKKSVLLLGPRQTGKTTLIDHLTADKMIDFSDPRVRLRYELNPGLLIDEIKGLEKSSPALIIVDEVQKVPAIMDSAQYLIDKKIAQLVLTGSSARKLKRDGDINLLPGRVIPLHLDALMLEEIPKSEKKLNDLLFYGSLPEIILSKENTFKEQLLEAYVITYLEEEIRAESVVRNLANFARFLELAASESGYTINMKKLSQLIGVASTTIESYYQILEDCLVIERIEPITTSKIRHRLSKAQKYLFFDLGVRRLAAREGTKPPLKYFGHLFEQFIGIELVRMVRLESQRTRIRYWRDLNGPEVDWVIDHPEKLIPIEVKWTDAPTRDDAKHLEIFIKEYDKAEKGYIICQTPHRMKISDQIIALSWRDLAEVLATNPYSEFL